MHESSLVTSSIETYSEDDYNSNNMLQCIECSNATVSQELFITIESPIVQADETICAIFNTENVIN